MKVNFFYEVRWIGEKKTTRNIVIILENRVQLVFDVYRSLAIDVLLDICCERLYL